MLHRSATNSFPARLSVYFQPVPPSSSGLSGLPGTLCGGGIASVPAALSRVLSSPAWSGLLPRLLTSLTGPDAGQLAGALYGAAVHDCLDQGEDRALQRGGS